MLTSPAMVNGVIELAAAAKLRCRITSGDAVQYSKAIPVEVAHVASTSMERYSSGHMAKNAVLYAETPELNAYTVVINYVFENGTVVADPYTATLAAGSDFSAEVKNPVVMGYQPYVNEETETRAQIVLNIENIRADVTHTVVIRGENPNDEEYSYLATGELELTPNTEYTYNGSDQLYLYCEQEAHTHEASCVICGKEEHTQHTEACLGACTHSHDLKCYSAGRYELVETSKPDEITSYPTEGIYTYTNRTTRYYLYMDGKWYCTESGFLGGGDDTKITLKCTHTHNDECYTCETHAHTADCYGCGKEEHSHDNTCTGTVEGLDSNLWKFVKSDTVVVNPDGSSVINVYYDRTTFTMTFKETGYNGDTLDTITDKWGADIKTRFETISKVNTFFWSAYRDGGSPWTSFMDIMPAENRTYYADNQSGSTTVTATYLAENLEGTGYETLYTVSFNGSSTITVTKEEFVDIKGFTFNDSLSTDIGERYSGSKF